MPTSREILEVALGGLIHDIGKFRQRTGFEIDDKYLDYCPVYKGRASHYHAAHTAAAIDEHLVPKGMDSGAVFRYAANHHRNEVDDDGERAVQLADRLASGHDRDTYRKYSDAVSDGEASQQEHFIRARHIPIFSRVSVKDMSLPAENLVYPLTKLSPDVKPEELRDVSLQQARGDYGELWSEFTSVLAEKLGDYQPDNNWLNALSSLLEIYTWAVPASSFGTLPETSLYDHCRLVSAFASAIYRYARVEGMGRFEDEYVNDNPVFCLVQGDFSGIQKFIFDFRGESEKYSAKMLRARSFHVSLMTEVVAGMVCDEIGLPHTAVVMNAGGKFTVIAPNLQNIDELVNNIRKRIDDEMFEQSFGQTRFAVASVDARPSDFLNPGDRRFGDLLGRLAVELEKVKLRPAVPHPVFDEYLDQLGANDVCVTCGSRPADNDGLCSVCEKFRTIGESLVKPGKRVVCTGFFDDGFDLVEGRRYCFAEPGKILPDSLVYDLGDIESPGTFRGWALRRLSAYVPVFSDDDIPNPRYKDIAEDADGTPSPGAHKTFRHIGRDACVPDDEGRMTGRDHIIALKADIDNLGEIFVRGLREHTFSRAVGLSRMMDFFFTGWLPAFLAGEYPSTYTIFAGGDDLFLIGPWRQTMELAGRIRRHLSDYTGRNPSVTISAGLKLARPALPVRHMADDAEEKLDCSKDYARNGDKKDAVTVFGQTVSWEHYEELADIAGQLETMLNDGMSAGFLYRLFHFVDMNENIHDDIRNTKWRAMFRYITHRNYGGKSADEDLLQRISGIPEWIERYGTGLKIALSSVLYKRRR